MAISRRGFFGRAGALGVWAGVGSDKSDSYTAYCLTAAPLYDAPDGVCLGHLAQDSIHAVRGMGEWLALAGGYVPRTAMSPLLDFAPNAAVPDGEFLAECRAPSAALREYADPAAPIAARLGHGAVIHVSARLTDRYGGTWYEAEPFGWAEESAFAVHQGDSGTRASSTVHLSASRLSARIGSTDWPLYGTIRDFIGARGRIITREAAGLSATWTLRTDFGLDLCGAWSHNRFGLADGPIDQIELSMDAARSLYSMARASDVQIVVEE